MDENVQNTPSEETMPSEAEKTTEETTAATTPTEGEESGTSGEQTESSTGAAEEQSEQPLPFMTVRFNKEHKDLSEEEAKAWAQKGMKYESSYNALSRLAAANGTGVDAFLDKLEQTERKMYEDEIREKYGDDDDLINKLMDLYDRDRNDRITQAEKAAAQKAEEEQKTLHSRIADEFIALQKEFPELSSIDDLPKSVMKAANDGMPLGFAYLLHQHHESKKKTNAAEVSQSAKEASTGSMATQPEEDAQTKAEQEFLKGLWRR